MLYRAFALFSLSLSLPSVQALEKEGHKAISLQEEQPLQYLDDDDLVMGEEGRGGGVEEGKSDDHKKEGGDGGERGSEGGGEGTVKDEK